MRRAFYRDRRQRNPFPEIMIEIPDEMDGIPLPEHIAFVNQSDVKSPFVFYYSHTVLFKGWKTA